MSHSNIRQLLSMDCNQYCQKYQLNDPGLKRVFGKELKKNSYFNLMNQKKSKPNIDVKQDGVDLKTHIQRYQHKSQGQLEIQSKIEKINGLIKKSNQVQNQDKFQNQQEQQQGCRSKQNMKSLNLNININNINNNTNIYFISNVSSKTQESQQSTKHSNEDRTKNIQQLQQLYNNYQKAVQKNTQKERKTNYNDPQEVFDELQITRTLLKKEEQEYFRNQGFKIDMSLRDVLVDWLYTLFNNSFKLQQETQILIIHVVDKYLQKKQVSKQYLQLLGLASIFIVSKYEEVYPPDLQKIHSICDQNYSQQQIIDMELSILQEFRFQLTNIVSANTFLERFIYLNQCGQANVFTNSKDNMNCKQNNLSRFICELAISDHQFLCYRSSLVAASSIYLSNKLFKQKYSWNKKLADESGYEEHDIFYISKQLIDKLERIRNCRLQGVRNKFRSQKFSCVANFNIQKVANK